MNLDGFFMILCVVIVAVIFVRRARASVQRDDFEYLTLREQLAIANKTGDKIAELEQLGIDMEQSTVNDVMMLHIEWVGRDNEEHEIDLHCDGINACTADMIDIVEREIHDLKNELAHQCAILSEAGRSRQNRRQYDQIQEGGGSVDEIVSTLRESHLNG